ncbi:hypothetical protein CBG49_14785 [Capnocytophaga endodontalis]|uniref:Uncharacterized protein n=1 Tax=Capnocytophaga endodontalis TaxID=2708117 RepID=A0A1Z4BSM0_9FLAO|nr:hypothetical protein CBG49_14785 [Capnocytophaga endodontalis]
MRNIGDTIKAVKNIVPPIISTALLYLKLSLVCKRLLNNISQNTKGLIITQIKHQIPNNKVTFFISIIHS